MSDLDKWPYKGHMPAGADAEDPDGCRGNCDGVCEGKARELIVQELRLAKSARDEWSSRWQFAESRLTAVWDDAIHSVRLRLGQHDPKCITHCVRCWFYDELVHMLRGDANNYVPVKARLRENAEELLDAADLRAQSDDTFFFDSYERGVRDVMVLVEKLLGDNE